MNGIRSQAAMAAAIFLAMTPPLLIAHHGWGGYDSGQLLRLTGTIEAPQYVNPHGTMRLRTPEKTWLVVLAPPARMENRGLARETLAEGAAATVEGYPNRTDTIELRAERITIDGNTVELR